MKYELLSIESIDLDYSNPRIKHWIEMYGDNITSEAVALALTGGDTGSYAALRESIRVNQGLISPIIVNRTDDGRQVVIEGNTRLKIFKEFAEGDPKGPWGTIPAIVYEGMSEVEIHAIRLQAHLVGPREWDPFSKAKYLYQLSVIDKLPMAMIISYCGGKNSEIQNLINAYEDVVRYYFPAVDSADGMSRDPKEFSKFVELQKQSVTQALIANNFTKSDFARWVVDGNVDTALNVRKIPAVLSNKTARAEFLKTNITEAVKLLAKPEPSAASLAEFSVYQLSDEVCRRLRALPWKEVESLAKDPAFAERRESLLDLRDGLNELLTNIEED